MYKLIHYLKCVLNFIVEKVEVLGSRNGDGGSLGKNDHIFEPCDSTYILVHGLYF